LTLNLEHRSNQHSNQITDMAFFSIKKTNISEIKMVSNWNGFISV